MASNICKLGSSMIFWELNSKVGGLYFLRSVELLYIWVERCYNNIAAQKQTIRNNDTMRKLSLFIATSLDGYIAKPNDDLSFLNVVEKEGEDYGYAEFTANIDTLIIGRKTYDYVLENVGSSHYDNGQRDVYVITRTERPKLGRTTFYTGNLKELVQQLKSENGKNIYCDGGAEVINELLKYDLIDEFIISIVPVLLGNGTRLFKDGRPEQQLEFVSAKSFDTGLTQLYYKRKR